MALWVSAKEQCVLGMEEVMMQGQHILMVTFLSLRRTPTPLVSTESLWVKRANLWDLFLWMEAFRLHSYTSVHFKGHCQIWQPWPCSALRVPGERSDEQDWSRLEYKELGVHCSALSFSFSLRIWSVNVCSGLPLVMWKLYSSQGRAVVVWTSLLTVW